MGRCDGHILWPAIYEHVWFIVFSTRFDDCGHRNTRHKKTNENKTSPCGFDWKKNNRNNGKVKHESANRRIHTQRERMKEREHTKIEFEITIMETLISIRLTLPAN